MGWFIFAAVVCLLVCALTGYFAYCDGNYAGWREGFDASDRINDSLRKRLREQEQNAKQQSEASFKAGYVKGWSDAKRVAGEAIAKVQVGDAR